MAVAPLYMDEEVSCKIAVCLSREIKAVESLARNLSSIRNRGLSEVDTDVIQMLVQEAHSGAQEAYDMASGYLRKVQSECEQLTEQKGQLQDAIKEKKQQLSSLQAQLPNIEKEKEEYEYRLHCSRQSLRDAEQELEKQQEDQRSMRVGRDVGIGLLFLPIIGTIAGAITVGICETRRAEAESNCRWCSEKVKEEEQRISKCSSDLQSCISHIQQVKEEIDQTEKRIKSVEDELDRLHKLLSNLFELDSQLKHGTVAVNELLGKVEVLKFRSEKFCNVDALVIVLNDIIAHILKLPNLLDGKVLQLEASTVEKLESLSGQLKAIEWSDSDVSQWC